MNVKGNDISIFDGKVNIKVKNSKIIFQSKVIGFLLLSFVLLVLLSVLLLFIVFVGRVRILRLFIVVLGTILGLLFRFLSLLLVIFLFVLSLRCLFLLFVFGLIFWYFRWPGSRNHLNQVVFVSESLGQS